MRAKWRKAIWAILAVLLLMAHLSFLFDNEELDFLIYRVVRHFGISYHLYYGWKGLAVLAWLVSAGAVLLVHCLQYGRFRRRCIEGLRVTHEEAIRKNLEEAAKEAGLAGGWSRGKENILYQNAEAREPFVMGFRRPVLVLPEKGYDSRVLHFIFLHECHHIKSRDMAYKLFMLAIQCLLWFQPLMYLLKAVAFQDVEVACDEAVVAGKSMEARQEYGNALLESLRQPRERRQVYSSGFYHGKRLMKARIAAIMREDRKWDLLAYVSIAVLLVTVGVNVWHMAGNLRGLFQAGHQEQKRNIYEGYGIPESFSEAAVKKMVEGMAPLYQDAYYDEYWEKDEYEETEYAKLPYEAEGPWQVRLRDADRYADAVELLLQRYLFYYVDQERGSEWNPEEMGGYFPLEMVYSRLLAGDKYEAVFGVIFRYYLGYDMAALSAFPQELKARGQFARENGAYYAYFDWAVQIKMAKDYVFELEGIADGKEALAAYGRQYAWADFSDVPSLDLVYEVKVAEDTGAEAPGKAGLGTGEQGQNDPGQNDPGQNDPGQTEALPGTYGEGDKKEVFQVDTSTGVLRVSGPDGVMEEVPVPLEDILYRGDQMDGTLRALQDGSWQADEKKRVFAYGGSESIPFSVVYYDEETQGYRVSVVTRDYFGGRRIFVDFPENSQEGFLIFTGERIVWQESTILFRTEDGGRTWQDMGTAGPDFYREGHSLTTGAGFIDNQVGFVAIRDSKEPEIWRTEDGGRNWERQELPPAPQYYSMAYQPEVREGVCILYVGMEEQSEYGGIKARYESTDRGRTWEYVGQVIRK